MTRRIAGSSARRSSSSAIPVSLPAATRPTSLCLPTRALSKPFAIIRSMFVLAHLSDPHVGPLPRPGLAALAGKRAFGFANWHLRRLGGHRPAALDAITEDVRSAMPDHIAVTGDLINIALEQE